MRTAGGSTRHRPHRAPTRRTVRRSRRGSISGDRLLSGHLDVHRPRSSLASRRDVRVPPRRLGRRRARSAEHRRRPAWLRPRAPSRLLGPPRPFPVAITPARPLRSRSAARRRRRRRTARRRSTTRRRPKPLHRTTSPLRPLPALPVARGPSSLLRGSPPHPHRQSTPTARARPWSASRRRDGARRRTIPRRPHGRKASRLVVRLSRVGPRGGPTSSVRASDGRRTPTRSPRASSRSGAGSCTPTRSSTRTLGRPHVVRTPSPRWKRRPITRRTLPRTIARCRTTRTRTRRGCTAGTRASVGRARRSHFRIEDDRRAESSSSESEGEQQPSTLAARGALSSLSRWAGGLLGGLRGGSRACWYSC